MRPFRSKRGGVSIVAAFLIAVSLVSTITVGLMLVLQEQGSSAFVGVESQQQVLKSAREHLEASLESAANGQLRIESQNTGSVTAEITQLLVTKSDNSLVTLSMSPPQILMPLEEKTIAVAYTGAYSRLGLLTQRGNVFPVQTPTPTPTPTPEPFDFAISISPSSGTVQQTGSVAATVTVDLVSGSPQHVSLSASGLPSGVSASFSPSSNNPTFTSTLTMSTNSSTPTGTYTITVTGAGGGLTRTATYTLTVTSAPQSFNFAVSVNPSTGSAQQRGSIQTTVTITLQSGSS